MAVPMDLIKTENSEYIFTIHFRNKFQSLQFNNNIYLNIRK